MKNSKSENSELSLSEKLEKVEKIRKVCLRKIDEVLGGTIQHETRIRIYDPPEDLFETASDLGYTDGETTSADWKESPREFGYILISMEKDD